MSEEENTNLFLNTPEFDDQYVYISIWIATALMSYEQYAKSENGSKNISSDDMWFKQNSIVSSAQKLLTNNGLSYKSYKVEPARVSLWTVAGKKDVQGKEVKHCYLIESDQKRTLRRLNLIDESSEKTFPKSFIEKYGTRKVSLNGTKISINSLSDFVKNQFKEICKEESMSSFSTSQEDKNKKLEFDKNIILFGPPGTGKTYNSIIYAVAICENKNIEDIRNKDYSDVFKRYQELCKEDRIAFTTFHQSYGYEEFIEGLKPNIEDGSADVTYEKKSGIFKAFCEKAGNKKILAKDITVQEEDNPYVFIIDEINRGNISKIFGELITLIETSKRGIFSAKLPYTGDDFTVPSNVYIIGTMNTADRSISLMDTALRRRFSFIEMLPNEALLSDVKIGNLDVSEMLKKINKRIECLFDREHTIGHSFFMELKDNPNISKLSDIFKKSVIPLLQEYFYEDYSKIMLVLGDNCKSSEDYQFIKKVSVNAKDIFRDNDSEIDLPEFTYEINNDAFSHIESYIEIYKTVNQTDNKQ